MRVGLVGENWGLQHLAAWRSVPGVEVAAICTAHRETAEAVAREHAIPRAYWHTDELLADERIDVVDVITRPTVRVPIAMAALRAGKHLLQPLPFALDLAQAATLEHDAGAAGVVAAVEVLHRHTSAFLAMKSLVDAGFLGDLYTVQGTVSTGAILDPPPDYAYSWITDANSGASAMRNWGSHMLHVLTWLFGDVAAVAASLSTHEREVRFTDGTRKPNETVDTAYVLVRYAGGATGSLHFSWVTIAGAGITIDAAGSGGRLVLHADRLGPENAVLLTARRGAKAATPYNVVADRREVSLAAMCRHFAEAVANGDRTSAQPSFAEAHRVMRTVEAAYASAASGTWTDVR